MRVFNKTQNKKNKMKNITCIRNISNSILNPTYYDSVFVYMTVKYVLVYNI